MRPTYLRLKGAIGIKRGLGLDEITLDLSQINGLIALAGENGRGKSTVLENLTPYRTLFSRNGNLNQHFFLRDSEKEFHFTHEGHQYKTLLKIDAESDRGEAFIWKDGVSEVDGKRQSYDKYIESLLGSMFLFQNSVLCAQDSNKLTDLRTSELRQLFAEFLRLDKLQAWETTAKGCINVLEGQKDQINRRIEATGDVDAKIAGAQEYDHNISVEIVSWTSVLDRENDDLGRKLKEFNALKEIIASVEVTHKRRQDAVAALTSLAEDLTKLQAEKRADEEYFRQRREVLQGDLSICNNTLGQKDEILLAEKAIEEKNSLCAEIRAAIDGADSDIGFRKQIVMDTYGEMSKLTAQKDEARNAPAIKINTDAMQAAKKRKEDARLSLEKIGADREIYLLEQQIAQCEDKAKDLAARDPECQSKTCSFIVGALAAQGKVEELKAKLAERRSELERKKSAAEDEFTQAEAQEKMAMEAYDALMVTLSAKLAEFETAINAKKEAIDKATESIKAIENKKAFKQSEEAVFLSEIESLKKLAAKATDIAVAESKKAEIEKQIAELLALAKDTDEAHTSKIMEKSGQVEKQKALVDEIGSVDAVGLSNQLCTLDDQITEIKRSIVETQTQISDREKTLATIQTQIATLEASKAEIETAKEESKRLAGEISDWTYLRDACSKTGLQALEIDGVCPHIQHDANNLLFLTFGANYSVKIQTYDELENKEVFKIWVIREDGSEVLLDNLSGGQKVWLLKALRLALTLLSKQKSGRNFNAGFADEEDGALSVENARAFVSLYRSFMTAGCFELFLFISHKPECLSIADHTITFREGGVDIE